MNLNTTQPLRSDIEEKYVRLKQILQEMESVLIAFSGGTDSALLYKVASDVLGEHALGVTGRSPSTPTHDLEDVEVFVKRYNLNHLYMDTNETELEQYRNNPPNRCFYCKEELYSLLNRIKEEKGIAWIIDGTNADDPADHRPGISAARRQGVRSPLQEANLSKDDLRAISKMLDLPTWNKPASACLASRFPYGTPISEDKLKQIDLCEEFLRKMGIQQVRVRHHDSIARIEILPEDFPCILENRSRIVNYFKQAGYTYIALDLEGFRSGSLNVLLEQTADNVSQIPPEDSGEEEKEKKEKPFHPKTFGSGVYTLYTDGGCSKNPGPGAWAYVRFDCEGKEVARGSGTLDETTNNIAEYTAMIEGMKQALHEKVDKLHILSDSQLMVRQMEGAYKVRDRNLRELFVEALQFRRQFAEWNIGFVRREENTLADSLVGKQMKSFKNKNKKKPTKKT